MTDIADKLAAAGLTHIATSNKKAVKYWQLASKEKMTN